MLITTTPSVDGYTAARYHGIVFGEVISGVDFIRDFTAGIRNIVGGRSKGYEDELVEAREDALREMAERAEALGANAVVSVDVDYEVLGQGNMLMVTASGTAVELVARRSARRNANPSGAWGRGQRAIEAPALTRHPQAPAPPPPNPRYGGAKTPCRQAGTTQPASSPAPTSAERPARAPARGP